MPILITGSSGFIGKKLRQAIPEKTYNIDLKNGRNVLSTRLPKNIDVIYHLAAQTSVEKSWDDPFLDSHNINMIVRLVKFYPKAKIIYAQSGASADPSSSPYAFSKWAGGEYLKRFHKNYVICVFPNVYGGSQKSVVDLFNGQKEVTIFGDGEQIRDFVHVDDIIKGLIMAQKWPKGEYFMGSTTGTKIIDLAEGKVIKFEAARKEQRVSILPNTTPSWKPKINVMDYIK